MIDMSRAKLIFPDLPISSEKEHLQIDLSFIFPPFFSLTGSIFWYSEVYILPDTTTFEIIQWKSDKCFLASNLHIKWQNMSLCKLLAHQRNISQVIFSDSTTLKKENQQHKVSTLHSQEMKGIFLSWYY